MSCKAGPNYPYSKVSLIKIVDIIIKNPIINSYVPKTFKKPTNNLWILVFCIFIGSYSTVDIMFFKSLLYLRKLDTQYMPRSRVTVLRK